MMCNTHLQHNLSHSVVAVSASKLKAEKKTSTISSSGSEMSIYYSLNVALNVRRLPAMVRTFLHKTKIA